MKEKPILFNGEMVKAILDGRKTQTRRVIRPQPEQIIKMLKDGRAGQDFKNKWGEYPSDNGGVLYGKSGFGSNNYWRCPYGQPGDRLWVREGFWHGHVYAEEYYPGVYQMGEFIESPHGTVRAEPFMFEEQKPGGAIYSFEGDSISDYLRYVADCQKRDDLPSIKYEWEKRPSIHMPRWASRINLDVVSVKVERVQEITEEDVFAEGAISDDWLTWSEDCANIAPPGSSIETQRDVFEVLWDKINAKRGFGWAVNPFVWRVELELVKVVKQ